MQRKRYLTPLTWPAISFAAMILLGTLALCLPVCHGEGASLSVVDAAFLSTSAVCVTGLSPVDIKDYDTGKNGVQRYRCWDSCMYSDFTMMAHGNNRTTQKERFRQRFMHKLVYFPANNEGMYSCVGCGRCVEKCPAALNIVKVVKAFQKQGGGQ